MPTRRIMVPVFIGLMAIPSFAFDGRIVVCSDDWTLMNGPAYNAPNDAEVFATNVARWFAGGSAGRFLVYANNGALTGTQLRTAMESAGHTWVVNASADLSLGNLLTFNAVFVAGRAIDTTAFSNYLDAGGNMYIAAGTGTPNAAGEAAFYNPLLIPRGLQLSGPYSGTQLSVPVAGSSPLLAGVDHLYAWSGNVITDLTPGDARSAIILDHAALQIAIIDPVCTLSGDTNCDCLVNLTDLATLLANFGNAGGATWQDGDQNGDGNVDLSDLAALLANFGASCP